MKRIRPTYEERIELRKEALNANITSDNYSFKGKFTRSYLQENKKRGLGKGYTPSSYIATLFMNGNQHQHEKITNDMKNNPDSNFIFFSASFATAYYPIDMFDEKKSKQWKAMIALHRLSSDSWMPFKWSSTWKKMCFKDEDTKKEVTEYLKTICD